MNKLLAAVVIAGSSLFAEVPLDANMITTLKKLKPLDNKDVTIVQGVDAGSIYVLRLKVKDSRGVKIVPANVTKDMKNVIIGTAYDAKTGDALGTTNMKRFNKDAAFSIGDGKAGGEFYVFTDPDCPYCKRLHKQLEKEGLAKYAKIHIFFYPLDALHPDARRKSEYILSLPESKRASAFAAMEKGESVPWKNYSPDERVKQKMALFSGMAKELGVKGTPSFFDEGGNEIDARVFIAYLRAIKKKVLAHEASVREQHALKKSVVRKDEK